VSRAPEVARGTSRPPMLSVCGECFTQNETREALTRVNKMMPDAISKVGWEEMIASEFQQADANLHVIGEAFWRCVNQLQEAQQRSCDHLASVSETLAQLCRDEFRLLHQTWQGMFDKVIASFRNDPRLVVALEAAHEKFGPGTFF
jgi:hypothetical protein